MLFNLFSKWLRDNLITFCFSVSTSLYCLGCLLLLEMGTKPLLGRLAGQWAFIGPSQSVYVWVVGKCAHLCDSIIARLLAGSWPIDKFPFPLLPLAVEGFRSPGSSRHIHVICSSTAPRQVLTKQGQNFVLRSDFVCEVPRKMKLGYSSGVCVLPIRTPVPPQGHGPLLRNSKQSGMGAGEYFRNQRLLWWPCFETDPLLGNRKAGQWEGSPVTWGQGLL